MTFYWSIVIKVANRNVLPEEPLLNPRLDVLELDRVLFLINPSSLKLYQSCLKGPVLKNMF
jgi:hypothetical protein